MDTPLYSALQTYLEGEHARFHMPGHKGVLPAPLAEAALWDITEVTGADSLYEAEGPIARCEEDYARRYGAGATLLSAGGSTLCIQAMLALFVPQGGRVLAARGVHTAAVNAMALLDLEPRWLYPDLHPGTGLAVPVTASMVLRGLEAGGVDAVYLTSPDYFGTMADIPAIAAVCRAHGVPLLVDNAHGAHLGLLRPPRHPIALGADACCDSLHKTLPALTGAALFHLRNGALRGRAKTAMSLFGSTSPSYLIMLSADRCLAYLQERGVADFAAITQRVAGVAKLAGQRGFLLPPEPADPARLTLGFRPLGYDAGSFGEAIRGAGIEPEYLGRGFCVLLPGPDTPEAHWKRLERFVEALPPRPAAPEAEAALPRPRAVCPLRQAMFAPGEVIPVEQCVGRVAASVVSPCPPGIPLVLPGEEIGAPEVEALKRVGISGMAVLQ